MKQRLHVVTLGVSDLRRAKAFYEGLGWRAAPASNDNIIFFDLGPLVLGLFGRGALADDAAVNAAGKGFRAVTLAHNVASEEDVNIVLEEAQQAGATLVKAPRKADWGGYSGYFADPDGHLWEIAYNPFFPLDADGYVRLPSH